MLQRLADLGMGLAEAVAKFPLRTSHFDGHETYHYELLSRGVRRSLALEAKLTDDARRRHKREVHGAPAPRERSDQGEPLAKPLPLVTTEDVESVIGPEPVVRETAENLLKDTREKLLDRFVDDHSPAVVAAAICRDLEVEEDLSVFLEPVPTRDDPWVQAEVAAAEIPEVEVPAAEVPEVGPATPDAPDQPSDGPPPVAKGHDPP